MDDRAQTWRALDAAPWDLVIIGGGISGAGVAREAARGGARVLLVEAQDFAWGTSSRSSKMVHGGLRYLASGQVHITAESVRERERLLREAPGLVQPMDYVFPHYGGRLMAWGFDLVLAAYDLLAGKWQHGRLSRAAVLRRFPGLAARRLRYASYFMDTLTDDARLTLRVLQAAAEDGAVLLNYVRAERPLRLTDGSWQLRLHAEDGAEQEVRARCVVNCAGAWADALRGGAARLRPLRGSHLLFPRERLPLDAAIALHHPDDGRIMFLYPWAGATVIGTTDLDHRAGLDQEPAISAAETDYLLKAANTLFPETALSRADIRSTWAGVRPIIDQGEGRPSAQSREHAVWDEGGLITLAGGKLTTFRLMARDALKAASRYCPALVPGDDQAPVLSAPPAPQGLEPGLARRLTGRYGPALPRLLAEARDREPVPGTDWLWAELEHACRHEAVRHLDDLLLRRSRLGLVLPEGGAAILPELENRCRPLLGWDAARWAKEAESYRARWRRAYSVPEEDESRD
ncbi:MAG: glycerol-3-phosphate dehydrogenase/oxidase [Gammaproteobacteria bacterium]|nr:glycerol-3-phosphate dehydrogenase/oxidase [Gammaproteobacteria bacterium]